MNQRILLTPELARAMHRRMLAAWAADALRLRRAGLDVPSARHLRLRPSVGPGRRPGAGNGPIAQILPDDAQERAA